LHRVGSTHSSTRTPERQQTKRQNNN
jgi:hypothetical protein